MVDYILTQLLPKYAEAQAVVKFLDKKSVAEVSDMQSKINEQTGNPRNVVDWSNPDKWIEERLQGKAQELAMELWKGSKGHANPRYLWRPNLFIDWQNLLQKGDDYSITKKGSNFIKGDDATIKAMDSREGLDFLLNKIKEYQPCKKGDLLEAWEKFLKNADSKIKTNSVIQYSLWCRLSNLLHRNLVKRKGIRYSVTEEGETYLKDFKSKKEKIIDISDSIEEKLDDELDEQRKIFDTIEDYNQKILKDFRQKMLEMHPKKFEEFIGKLISNMGYDIVKVTSLVKDKGIDLVAKRRIGFHEGVEVFQVKRTDSTIGDNLINQIMGAMDTYKTSFGVFITLGSFTGPVKKRIEVNNKTEIKKLKLIDGQKLLKLIEKYEVGIKKINTSYEIYEINYDIFE